MPLWLKEWWPVAVVVCSVLGPWLTWSMARKYVTREDCGKCSGALLDRIATLENQRSNLEARLGSLPQLEALHDLAINQTELAGEIEALKATMEGLRALLQRIEHPLNLMLEGHLNGPRRGTG